MDLLHPLILEKAGIAITEEDKRILGHAYAVFFARNYLKALSYTSKDPAKKALLVLNRNALEDRGYLLVDCKSEGIKCERRVALDFGFQALLVPDEDVTTYKARMQDRYHTAVFPLSDLRR